MSVVISQSNVAIDDDRNRRKKIEWNIYDCQIDALIQ